jgi:hypothetical protein
MRFLVDNQLPPSLARWLRDVDMMQNTFSRADFTCLTTVPCGRGRSPMTESSSARTRTFST